MHSDHGSAETTAHNGDDRSSNRLGGCFAHACRRAFARLLGSLSEVDGQRLITLAKQRVVVGQSGRVELEIIPRRRRRRVDMQRDQFVARRLQIRHLVNRCVAASRYRSRGVSPGSLGHELAARADGVLGLGCAAFDHAYDA